MRKSSPLIPQRSKPCLAFLPLPLAQTHLTNSVCSLLPKTSMQWLLRRFVTLAILWHVLLQLMKQQPWKHSTSLRSNTKCSNLCLTQRRALKMRTNRFTGEASITWLEQTCKSVSSKSLVTARSSKPRWLPLTESGTWLVFTTGSLNHTLLSPIGTRTADFNCTHLSKCRITHTGPLPPFWMSQCIKSMSFAPLLAVVLEENPTPSLTKCVQPFLLANLAALFASPSIAKKSIGSTEAVTQATSKSR